jgi:hypothetical protein
LFHACQICRLLVRAVVRLGAHAVQEIPLVEIASCLKALSALTFVRPARLMMPALPLADHAESVTVNSTKV